LNTLICDECIYARHRSAVLHYVHCIQWPAQYHYLLYSLYISPRILTALVALSVLSTLLHNEQPGQRATTRSSTASKPVAVAATALDAAAAAGAELARNGAAKGVKRPRTKAAAVANYLKSQDGQAEDVFEVRACVLIPYTSKCIILSAVCGNYRVVRLLLLAAVRKMLQWYL
jgi:hypothetical protein